MATDKALLTFYVHVLTDRQREVVEWVCQGLSNAEVSDEMCLAEATVADHLRKTYEMMGTLEGIKSKPNRFLLIHLFTGFFERHPELKKPRKSRK